MGKRELIALLNLSSWCLVMVGRLFLAVPRGCLQFVIVVFPDHTHLLFLPTEAVFDTSIIQTVKMYLNIINIYHYSYKLSIFLPSFLFFSGSAGQVLTFLFFL